MPSPRLWAHRPTLGRRHGRLPPGRFALAHRQTGEVFRTFQRKPPARLDYCGRYIRCPTGRDAEPAGRHRASSPVTRLELLVAAASRL